MSDNEAVAILGDVFTRGDWVRLSYVPSEDKRPISVTGCLLGLTAANQMIELQITEGGPLRIALAHTKNCRRASMPDEMPAWALQIRNA